MKNTKQEQSKRFELKWIPVHSKIPSNTLSDDYGLLKGEHNLSKYYKYRKFKPENKSDLTGFMT